MAKTPFTYACGCEGLVVERNRSSADYRARRMSEQECWKCQNAAESAAAATAARAAALPELTGTPKQIAYAEALRARTLKDVETETKKFLSLAGQLSAVATAELRDATVLIEDEVRSRTESKWWIETKITVEWMEGEIYARGLAPTAIAEIKARPKRDR